MPQYSMRIAPAPSEENAEVKLGSVGGAQSNLCVVPLPRGHGTSPAHLGAGEHVDSPGPWPSSGSQLGTRQADCVRGHEERGSYIANDDCQCQ